MDPERKTSLVRSHNRKIFKKPPLPPIKTTKIGTIAKKEH